MTAENRLNYSQLLQDILTSYQHYHAVRRRELEVGNPSKTLTWYCISQCGGIGDRLKGIYPAFLLALVTNRTFFIHLSDEVQKTMFLEPSAIDWRPVHKCVAVKHDQNIDNFGTVPAIMRRMFGTVNNFSLKLNEISKTQDIYINGRDGICKFINHYYDF